MNDKAIYDKVQQILTAHDEAIGQLRGTPGAVHARVMASRDALDEAVETAIATVNREVRDAVDVTLKQLEGTIRRHVKGVQSGLLLSAQAFEGRDEAMRCALDANRATMSLLADLKGVHRPADDAVLDTSIQELEFSVRAYNCLWNANIRTVGDLLHYSDTRLRKVKNLGRTTITEIDSVLHGLGLTRNGQNSSAR